MMSVVNLVPPPPALPGFVPLARVEDALTRPLSHHMVKGVPIVLVNHAGTFHAMYGLCPHKQAPLAEGDIEDAHAGHGTCSVKCPRHRKKFSGGLHFRCDDGTAWVPSEPCVGKFDSTWQVPVYEVRTHDGFVYTSEAPVRGTLPPAEEIAAATGALSVGDGDKKREAVSSVATGTAAGAAAGAAASAVAGVRADGMTVRVAHRDTPSGAQHNPLSTFFMGTLSELAVLTPETSVYRVALPAAYAAGAARTPLSHRVCWHLALKIAADAADAEEPEIVREYTPVSNFSTLLKAEPYVDLLIKRYAGGKLTSRLQAVLAAGSPVQVSLPGATLVAPSMLPPETVFRSPVVPATPVSGGGRRDALILIAGGTGITPMMQVLEWAAAGGDELHPRPIVYFITSNQTLRHDLLVDELRSLASRMAGDLHLLHAYTRAEDLPAVDECIQPTPKLHLGRIDAATLRAFLPPPPAEVMAGGEASVGQPRVWRVIVSGPSGMFEDVRSHLVEAGHSSELLVELEA